MTDGNKLGRKYQKALDQLEIAERRMARAFTAWLKARRVVKSMGKKLDKLPGAAEYKGCVGCDGQGPVNFMGLCAKCEPPEPLLGESDQAKRFIEEMRAFN